MITKLEQFGLKLIIISFPSFVLSPAKCDGWCLSEDADTATTNKSWNSWRGLQVFASVAKTERRNQRRRSPRMQGGRWVKPRWRSKERQALVCPWSPSCRGWFLFHHQWLVCPCSPSYRSWFLFHWRHRYQRHRCWRFLNAACDELLVQCDAQMNCLLVVVSQGDISECF